MTLTINASRGFARWLDEQRIGLAFTASRASKVFLLGLQPDGRLSLFERSFPRCQALWSDGQSLWLSTLFQLWRFESVGPTADGFDRLFVPRLAYTTGDLDIHDVQVDGAGRVVFVNTRCDCLATVSPTHSFVPLWRPPWIDKLAAEDRSHLTGVALRDGRPRYVTATARSDVPGGWRDKRLDGGLVLDAADGSTLASGLSMPASPRWHNGQLWLLEAGEGALGSLNPGSGDFVELASWPGRLRGLALVGDHAVIGLSTSREDRDLEGLPVGDGLKESTAEPRCGLGVVDLRTGETVHWLRLDGVVREIDDVAILPGVRRPAALGLKTDEIHRVLSVGEPQVL